MNLRPKASAINSDLASISERMEKARQLLTFLTTDNAPAWQAWLANEIRVKMENLCNADMPEKDTGTVRAEIWTLRRIARLTEDTRAHMQALSEQAKGLQAKLEEMHTRGYPDTEAPLAAARNLTRSN
jgi:hypothetical protein